MELDPHTLQQILLRIQQQMRCPQCGNQVPVDFASVRVVADESLLLQLKCDACNAYIVLHASLQGAEHLGVKKKQEDDALVNASSTLQLSNKEVNMLEKALGEFDGSFEKLFEQYGAKEETNSEA